MVWVGKLDFSLRRFFNVEVGQGKGGVSETFRRQVVLKKAKKNKGFWLPQHPLPLSPAKLLRAPENMAPCSVKSPLPPLSPPEFDISTFFLSLPCPLTPRMAARRQRFGST